MRSGILISWIVVVLCACAAAVERPAQISPGDILIAASGDPNDPNGVVDPNKTWDPAEHLAADWRYVSVSMTSSVYNPVYEPDTEAQGPQWSMSVTSSLDVIDRTGLIGWSTQPTSAKAFDQDGNLVSSMESSSSFVRWYQQPRSWSMAGSFSSSWILDSVHMSFPMDPKVDYPAMFSKVEWSMNVLVAQETQTVDIPFEPNDTWVEITPGFEVMVEQATVEEGKYQYRIKVKYDNTQVDYMMGGSVHLWRDETLPSAAVLDMQVLNADGQSIRSLGGGAFSTTSSYSGTTGQMNGSGSCDACGMAATFRYTLAFDLHEQEANFVLENVPVPEF